MQCIVQSATALGPIPTPTSEKNSSHTRNLVVLLLCWCLLWLLSLLLLLLGLNGLDDWVFVLGSDLDGCFWLGPGGQCVPRVNVE